MQKIKKCLMIEMPDKKKFFTDQKNYNDILYFANNFNCEISVVNLEKGKILLSLKSLAKAISCIDNSKDAKFSIISVKKTKKRNKKRGS